MSLWHGDPRDFPPGAPIAPAPPTFAEAARAMFPAMRALLGPQCEAAGAPMPATFDDLTPDDREKFVAMVRRALEENPTTAGVFR